jgi:hypothetical protein
VTRLVWNLKWGAAAGGSGGTGWRQARSVEAWGPTVGALNFFLYLIYHDFRKINGRIKIFEKCTSAARTPRRQAPAAAPHGVKSLPPRGTAAGAWFRRQGGAARRGARTLPPSGTRVGPYRCHTAARSFYFF